MRRDRAGTRDTRAYPERVLRSAAQVPRWVQFLMTGGLGYLLGAGLLYVFIDVAGAPMQPAYVAQVVITCAFVWSVNRYVTWREYTGSVAATLPAFAASRGVSLLLAWAIYTILIGRTVHLGMLGGAPVTVHYQVANALGVAAATACNYLACRHVVFVDAQQQPALTAATRVRRFTALAAGIVGALIALACLVADPFALLLAIWALNALLMLVVAVATSSRMLYTWQLPERVGIAGHAAPIARSRLRFSVVVPARKEPILEQTLLGLLRSDYPHDHYQVVVVIGHDDPETFALAQGVADDFANVTVVVDTNETKSKPLALEAARPMCTGDLVGILDAESIIAPALLKHVNALAVAHPEVGIFQGPVQLMNHRAGPWRPPVDAGPMRRLGAWLNGGTSWWRARNCVEYYGWFMSRLRFQAQAGVVPLGGNTVFVRRPALEQLGGWDPACLTEDCDLGMRAAALGLRTLVFLRPDLATREETPDTLSGLVVQRTRWMSGFIQVLRKRDWTALPPKKRLLAVEALTMPLFQAYAGLAAIVSILLAIWLRAPVILVLWACVPLLITLVNLALEHALFCDFTRTFDLARTPVDSVRFILAGPVYQLVLSVSAVRAVYRLARGDTRWEKTAHSGQHLAASAGAELARTAA